MTRKDYDILGPALAIAMYPDHYVDDFGRIQRIDYTNYGLCENFDGLPRFSPLDPENPETELPRQMSQAVINALKKCGMHEVLVMDLGLDADEVIP